MLREENTADRKSIRHGVDRVLAVVASAFLLCWPSFWNRFPLVYPDGAQYVWNGKTIVRQLIEFHRPDLVDARSEIFSVFAYLFYRSFGVWTALALQALLASWILWLVVRSVVAKRQVTVFLALSAVLSCFTAASWFVSFLMPDILAPLLYLCLYLLVFAPETLHRWEKWLLLVIAWFAITAHATHLVLAAWLCLVLGVCWLCGWSALRQRRVWLLRVCAVTLLAAGTQVALHTVLYGEPSVYGVPLPFLTGRLIGDGPAQTYLQEHCDGRDWVLCGHLENLPKTDSELLGSFWQTATPAQRRLLRKQEMPLLMGVLVTYPREQVKRSWSNFVAMMGHVGVDYDFTDNPVWSRPLDSTLWKVYGGYLRSRQRQNAMPWLVFRGLQEKVMLVALGSLVLLLPGAWQRKQDSIGLRMLGLTAIVFAVLPVNAFLGGVISCDDPRLQGRVAWLLVLLAALLAVVTWQQSRRVTTS
jgi:hypothetical protein